MSATTGDRLLPPTDDGVAVRMYRAGLGDCFLLALGKRADPRYVLIDCGIHKRQTQGPKRLAQVLNDIVAATGGKIHVAVVTHEHADHLSGFVQPDSPFRAKGHLTIERFWVAWTEKVGDHQADILRKRRGANRMAIQKAVERLEKTGLALQMEALRGLTDFKAMPGLTGTKKRQKNPDKASSNEAAIELLKQHARKVEYCEPGQVLPVHGAVNARAYVLGPPRDEDLLKTDRPAGGKEGKNRETYLTGEPTLSAFWLAPSLGLDTSLHDDYRHPFDDELRRVPVEWRDGKVPRTTPKTVQTRGVFGGYFEKRESWRRIDGDWLGGAEQLALDLEADTNNTSLVLAFEYGKPGEGKILLFVGDAQVGNWLSWRSYKFPVGQERQTADDLLARTVLYKVGHHGSHNATVKRVSATDPSPYGLELMPKGLIALIPVDREAAQKAMPKPWDMPHEPLYRRLLEKTDGRVLRSDGLGYQFKKDKKPSKAKSIVKPVNVPGVSGVRWREAAARFQAGRRCPIYYDIEFTP